MAKFGNGSGAPQRGTPPFIPPQSSPRPVARGQVQPQQGGGGLFGNIFTRGQGILPERGSEAQREIVGMLMKAAMQNAGKSGSPLLAFLAPIAAGGAMARAENLAAGAADSAQQESWDTFTGLTGATPEMVEVLAAYDDPNLPAPAKAALKKRYEAMINGMPMPGEYPHRSGGGTSAPRRRTPSQAKRDVYGSAAAPDPTPQPIPSGGPGPSVMDSIVGTMVDPGGVIPSGPFSPSGLTGEDIDIVNRNLPSG